jgi:hypothetical protein
MRVIGRPVVTGAATFFILASAASFAIDQSGILRDGEVERTVAIADVCGATTCSIAYKTDDGGPPSRVVPVR